MYLKNYDLYFICSFKFIAFFTRFFFLNIFFSRDFVNDVWHEIFILIYPCMAYCRYLCMWLDGLDTYSWINFTLRRPSLHFVGHVGIAPCLGLKDMGYDNLDMILTTASHKNISKKTDILIKFLIIYDIIS